jgi:hypothetical protein
MYKSKISRLIGTGFRSNLAGVFLVSMLCFVSAGWATESTIENDHLAIEGYDPVAYFTMLTAVKGLDSISYEWLNKKWNFSSPEHRDLFISDPMSYIPNYGGFCSVDEVIPEHALVHEIDPETWRIVDDKLYLFYSEDTLVKNLPALKWKKVKAGLQ